MSQTVRVVFALRLGQHVTYDGATWEVAARRYQEGTVSRFVQYGLVPCGMRAHMAWAHEADIAEAQP